MTSAQQDAANIGTSIPSNLCKLIKESYPHKASGEALVASVYGEWGIGKTWCLKQVEEHFNTSYNNTIDRLAKADSPQSAPIYIPVFFSPWRYEQERHLVIPLLKSIEHRIQRHEQALIESESNGKKGLLAVKNGLKDTGSGAARLATALTAGLKFEFGFPGAKLSVDGKSMLDEPKQDEAKQPEDQSQQKTAVPLESLYYESFSSLEALSGADTSEYPLRLVILIDDLDRCLPEKAVEMLESIKSFLNIQNFAFVLAVDDEVIERGINHRYKDYFLNPNSDANGNGGHNVQPPISGSEYLEKIVHVPVHLPRWSNAQVKGFLLEHFADLFKLSATNKVSSDQKHADPVPADEAASQPNTENTELLDLFTRALPPVPRKLIRAAEGMRFKIQQIRELGGSVFLDQHDSSFQHVARITLLQQLYPAVYRLLRSHSAVYDWLFESRLETNSAPPPSLLVKREQDPPPDGSSEGMVWPNFSDAVITAYNNRYAVSPLAAFDGNESSSSPWSSAEQKEQFKNLYVIGEAVSHRASAAAYQSVEDDARETASINMSDGDALASLLLSDKSSRQGFLVDQHLLGKKLSDRLFQQLLEDFNKGKNPKLLIDLDWLQDIAEILSAAQLQTLYRELRVLPKIQTSIQAPIATDPDGSENE